MGMYDHVKCNYPLPGAPAEVQSLIFQTKDFENLMDDYTITEEGKVILHKKIYEVVPETERPYYGKPEWESKPIFQIFGSLKSIPIGDEEIPYHGMIRIYTILDKEFFEYILKFTNGKVESVEKAVYNE